MVTDPPDGRIPPVTPQARERAATRAAARKGRGEADSYEDRSLYDRCISRGIPGSMMPAIYGNCVRHHTGTGRGRDPLRDDQRSPGHPAVVDAARGTHDPFVHGRRSRTFRGNTLVVETTNIDERVAYRGATERLKIIERFTPVAEGQVEWSITLDDPNTWARPWTFAMRLTRDETQPPFEYACHEGNYAMFNLLSIARAEEAAAARRVAPAPSR